MHLSRLWKIAIFTCLFSLQAFALANPLEQYQIYESDTNGDGNYDYLLKLSPEEVEIPYDISLQVERSAQQYFLTKDPDGSFTVSKTSDQDADWVLIDGNVTQFNYIEGGELEIAVRTNGSDPQVIVLSQSNEGVLLVANSLQSAALKNGSLASILDLNNDGQDEVLISGDTINTLSASGYSLKHDIIQNLSPKTWAGQSGAAHAAIQIQIPKELGPTPRLSLQYSSSANNGPVGVGFNLTGVSKIHYCTPVVDVDLTMGAAPYSDEERLCLDGRYLSQTSVGARFDNGATYMTEISNHSRLVFSQDNNAFEASLKGGGKMVFGLSRKLTNDNSKTIEWYLTRVEDEFGNGYDYNYKYQNQYEYLPLLEKIEYGSITVDISWESRIGKVDQAAGDDAVTGYVDEALLHRSGNTSLLRDRLKSVSVQRNVSSSGVALSKYELKYGVNHNKQSQLELVTLCSAKNDCADLSIDWYEGEALFKSPSVVANLANKVPDQKVKYLDLNGDGFVDLMYPGSNGNWWFRLGSNSGFLAQEIDTLVSRGATNYADFSVPIKAGLDHTQALIVADSVDASGADDLTLACVKGEEIYLYGSDVVASDDVLDKSAQTCGKIIGQKYTGGKLQYIALLNWYVMHADFIDGEFSEMKLSPLSNKDGALKTLGNRVHVGDFNKDGLQDFAVRYDKEIAERLHRYTTNKDEMLSVFIADTTDTGGNTSNISFRVFTLDSYTGDYRDGSLNIVDLDNNGFPDIEICSEKVGDNSCAQYIINNINHKNLSQYLDERRCSGYLCYYNVQADGIFDYSINYSTQPADKLTKTFPYIDSTTGQSKTRELYTPNYYADFNADGVVDRMYIASRGGEKLAVVNYSMGEQSESSASYENANKILITGDPYKINLLDFNGDGLLDILGETDNEKLTLYQASRVYSKQEAGEPNRYDRNIEYTARQIVSEEAVAKQAYRPTVYDYAIKSFASVPSGELGNLKARHKATLQYKGMPTPMDYNGDGTVDLLFVDSGLLKVTSRETGFENIGRIKKLTDSLGNITRFTYQNSKLEPNDDYDGIRFPYVNIANTGSLIAKIERGYGEALSNYLTTWYEFDGALYHLQGRGFVGYRHKISKSALNDDDKLKVVEEFNQSFPLTGTTKSTNQFWVNKDGAEQLISSSNSEFDFRKFGLQSRLTTVYPASQEVKKYELDAGLISTVTTSANYDDYGNAIETTHAVYGGSHKSLQQTTKTTNKYQHLNAANEPVADEIDDWRISFLTESEVVSDTREQISTHVTKLTPWLGTHRVASKLDYAGTESALLHEYAHENDGRLKSEYISSGEGALYTVDRRRVFENQAYEFGYLPSKVQNVTDDTVSIEYDPLWHKPVSETSIQGLTTTTAYNSLGQPLRTVSPEGVVTLNLAKKCQDECPVGALFTSTVLQMHKSQKGLLAPPQTTYLDQYLRVQAEQTKNANNQVVVQDYSYDLYGRLTYSTLPYTDSSNIQKIEYSAYDAFGRALTVTQPNGGKVIKSYQGDAKGVKENIDNQLQTESGLVHQLSFKNFNALGQVSSVHNYPTAVTIHFTYDAMGNLTLAENKYITTNLKTVSAGYNVAGLKTRMSDPDTGTYNYTYDSIGLLRTQSDSNNNGYVYQYNKLGQRETSTLNGKLESTWAYSDIVPGLLKRRFKTNFSESYQYDALHRIKSAKTKIKAQPDKQFIYEYDLAGRQSKITYPSGFSVANVYNPLGYLTAYKKPGTNDIYWQAEQMDAFGNWVGERFGNNIQTTRAYDPASGLLQSIKSVDSNNQTVQDLGYLWNTNGNLRQRTLNESTPLSAVTETFKYDLADRLGTATTEGLATGQRILSYGYDKLGNMTRKSDLSDIGGMIYGTNGARPSQLQQVFKNEQLVFSLTYDANGNVRQKGDVNFTYTAANKPSRIWRGLYGLNAVENSFEYDTDEQRYYQKQIAGNDTLRETYYFAGGGYEEIFDHDPVTNITIQKQKAYVGGVMIHTYTQSNKPEVIAKKSDIQYLHQDHLGSTQAISDATGSTEGLIHLAYDPFGKARQGNWENAATASDAGGKNPDWAAISLKHTSAGFTGHEMLADFDLIHMGGRVYDPMVGRMLQADPFIQAPDFDQSYNRYSYVWNNPLSMKDPTGFMAELHDDDLDMLNTLTDFNNVNNQSLITFDANVDVMYQDQGNDLSSLREAEYIASSSQHKDYIYAALSACAYSETCRNVGVIGFQPVLDGRPLGLDVSSFDSDFGFSATLFNRDGDYVFAIAGTDGFNDGDDNVLNAFFGSSPQMTAAIVLGGKVDYATSNVRSSLVFTGHSLGGALAAGSGIMNDVETVTFNAAGLSFTAGRFAGRYLDSQRLIRAYNSSTDLLSLAQDFPLGLPSAAGRRSSLGIAGFHSIVGVCAAMGGGCDYE